jgi:hypothetical protein
MRQPTKAIVISASLGLIAAGVSYLYADLYDYTVPMNGIRLTIQWILLVLCPPQFLFVMCIDCEVIGWGGVILYSIVGALNAALYALFAFMGYSLLASRNKVQQVDKEPTDFR